MTDTDNTQAKPTRVKPIITLDAKFFWDHANKEELVCQKCSDCGEFRFPPRPMCPKCHSVERDIVQLSGRGKVVSWIRPRHPKPVGFAEPPIVCVVELEEGMRMVTNVMDVAFEDVRAGMAVEVLFDTTMGNRKVPVFRPAKEA